MFLIYIAPTPNISFNTSNRIQRRVGDSLTIECRVDTVPGVSTVSISWIGGATIGDSRVTISTTTSSGNTHTSSLQFAYLMEGDEGNYTCNVMILENSTSSVVEILTLISKFFFV